MSDSERTEVHSPGSGSHSEPTLVEQLLEDQRVRFRDNRTQRVENYLDQHPTLAQRPEAILDLIYQEILHRRQRGETPSLDEYQARFPGLTEELRVQFEIDDALDDQPSSFTDPGETTQASGTSPQRSRADTAVAPLVPGYEVLGVLGRGGMGIVYKARQSALNRIVALKMVLGSNDLGGEELARFRTEAEAMARLQHPNIVQVFEVGEHDGKPFFSLEFCSGGTLRDKLRGEPLPSGESASLLETVARAMHSAHSAHIIHRDAKPANILLTGEGQPKITDFGLAKKLDDEGHTQSGAVMGTPSYMAPEQARGETKSIGPRADVYALGAILYECLTGRPPFKSATVLDTIRLVLTEDPIAPRRLDPRIPLDLETVCLKCLEKKIDDRYPSAEALADDLRRFRDGEPIHARPLSGGQRLVKWARRRPTTAALLAVSVVMLMAIVGLIVGASFQAELRDANSQLDRANQQLQSTNDELTGSNKALAVARREADFQRNRAEDLLYFTDMQRAGQAWRDGNLPTFGRLLDRHAKKDGPDRRGFEWFFLDGVRYGEVHRLEKHKFSAYSVRFNRAGSRVATGGLDGDIHFWDTKTGKLLDSNRDHGGSVLSMASSSNGRWLAVADAAGFVVVWDWKTGKDFAEFEHDTFERIHLDFAPNNELLACCYGSKKQTSIVVVWNVLTKREVRRLILDKQKFGYPLSIGFDPRGKTLAVGTVSGLVRILDTTTLEEVASFRAHPQTANALAFHPEQGLLATGGVDNLVKIWQIDGWKLLHSLSGHTSYIQDLAFSPDGSKLYSAGGDGVVRIWNPNNGRAYGSIQGHRGTINSIDISSDNGTLATASDDTTAALWDVKRMPEYRPLVNPHVTEPGFPVSHSHDVTSIAFAPDGSKLASCGLDKRLTLWEVDSGKVLWNHAKLEPTPRLIDFTHDGSALVVVRGDKSIQLRSSATGDVIKQFDNSATPILEMDCSPKEPTFAVAEQDGTIRVRDVRTGKETFTKKIEPLVVPVRGKDHRLPNLRVTGLEFSLDGEHLAACFTYTEANGELTSVVDVETQELVDAPYRQVRVWNLTTGKEVQRYTGHPERVLCLGVHPSGTWIASADQTGSVVIWGATTGESGAKIGGHRNLVNALAFSPDGKRLASGGTNTVRLWDTKTGIQTLTLGVPGERIHSLAYSPDGHRIATTSGGMIRLWEGVPRE